MLKCLAHADAITFLRTDIVADIGFVGGNHLGRSRIIDSERSINWYVEVESPTSNKPVALVPTPGVGAPKGTLGGVSRGERVVGNVLYVVASGTLWSINAAYVSTNLGSLTTTTGRIKMSDNGSQLMIVDGANGYIFDTGTSTFTQIADADFPNGTDDVTYQDGYFICPIKNGNTYAISALNDGLAWNALDIGIANGTPTDIVAVMSDHQLLWFFKEDAIELHYNNGNADFPFQRMQGAFQEVGCAAKYSPAKLDGSVFWLAKSPRGEVIVYRAQGYSKSRVSDHQIEFILDSYATVSDAIGMSYVEEGHSFYALTFPTADATWVYDAASGLWHERKSYTGTSWGRWMANHITSFNGETHITDYRNSNIYVLSHAEYEEDGQFIRRLRACRHINNDRKRLSFSSFEVIMERGAGLVSGQGVDPKVMIRISKDGGYTWSNEHWVSAGKIGEYQVRAKLNRLGIGRDWVFEVSVTDPIAWHIVEANLQ